MAPDKRRETDSPFDQTQVGSEQIQIIHLLRSATIL